MPVLSVLIAMASIQLGASVAKQLFPITGVLGTCALRQLFGSLVLILIWKPWRLKLTRSDLKAVLCYGVSLGFMNLFFYLAMDRIPLGIAVALEFIGPLSVALYSSRRPTDYLWALLAGLGIVLVLPISENVQSLDLLGIAFALLAGVCWATYIIFGQRMENRPGGVNVCLGMIVASLVVTPVGFATEGMRMFTLSVLPLAFVLSVLSSAFPYTLEMIGLRNLPAKTFSILMSVEPAFGALSGFILLNETLSVQQWMAILCVITASAGSALLMDRSARHPEQALVTPSEVEGPPT